MSERRYVTRGTLQRSLRSNAVPSSSEEGNLSPSDEDYFNSFEEQHDTNTRVRTSVLEFVHKVKWTVRCYSLAPTNTVIAGPVIKKYLFLHLCTN
ncbi:hypothetical protein TNCV_4172471 [Trichonephila clavipes]|nr:hypothetical protein TNCV_4172471 [Trichonephila clavipes]